MKNSLLLLTSVILLLTACGRTGNPDKNIKNTVMSDSHLKKPTFQEIGFFGSIKEDKWNSFLHAVKNNIANSRKESGNISFSLFQPEIGHLQPIWFERFKNKGAHLYHKEQNYFKDAIKVIQESLEGEARSIELTELDEIPALTPTLSNRPELSRYVILLFDVKPEKRQPFIHAMAEAVLQSRLTKGNLEFNLYQYTDDPNKFVLIEGWNNVANHEAQLKLDHIKQLNSTTKDFFVSNPMNTVWMVKDISQ